MATYKESGPQTLRLTLDRKWAETNAIDISRIVIEILHSQQTYYAFDGKGSKLLINKLKTREKLGLLLQ